MTPEEKKRERNKKYYEANKEKIKQQISEYEKSERGKAVKSKFQKSEKGKAINKKSKDKFYSLDSNNEKRKESDRKYRESNRSKRKEWNKVWSTNKRKEDPLFKLRINIRSLIRQSIINCGYSKKSKTHHILGCSFEEFKAHIESLWEPWMTWENYGLYNGELNYGWDYDHLTPVSSAVTEEEVIALNHYTNLQPLCSKVNRDIKKNKITYYFG
jgi:hypothetical protein